MRISKEVIEEIRSKTDIVDVISQYVSVEQKGKGYTCLCPFHDDKNPSLSISKEKQYFRCFACGVGGNVFQFVEKFENISFYNAVQKLGTQLGYNLTIDKPTIKIDPNKKPYYEILESAIQYTKYQLNISETAQNYIEKRQITQKQVEKFQLGYDDGNLEKFLQQKGYSYELMEQAYLVHVGVTHTQDVFKDRLLFPIHDLNGNPVGFSGRTLVNADAKYINTKDTLVYQKGELLYNYHRVKQKESKKEKVFLVEGAMDVLAFDKAEIEEVIAPMGTAITKHQIKALQRLNTKIYVCFDGDSAGKNATYKFGLLASEMGLNFEVVDWDSSKDPDEFLMENNTEIFKNKVNKTISWIQFLFQYLQSKYQLENYSDKKEYAKTIAVQIEKVKDPIEQKLYYETLKNITGFDYTNQTITHIQTVALPQYRFDKMQKAQLELINQMILSKRACDIYRNSLGGLKDELLNEIAQNIMELYLKQDEIQISQLFDTLDAKQCNLIGMILEDELFVKYYKEEIVVSNIKLIKIETLQSQLDYLKSQILQQTLVEEKNKLISLSIEITKKIQELKNQN